MFSFFSEHEYMPCEDCGASLARTERDAHVCEQERRVDYELFRLVQAEVAGFEEELGDYLASPDGRFQVWYAAQHRRRAA
jgi:hypothetical protein